MARTWRWDVGDVVREDQAAGGRAALTVPRAVGGAGEQLDEAGLGSARRRSRVLDQVLEITYTRVCPCKGLAWSRLPGVFSQPMVIIP